LDLDDKVNLYVWLCIQFMPKKIREIKQIASQAGFILQKGRGKGSHTYWIHPKLPAFPLTIPGKDGDDAPRYLEKELIQAIKALENLKGENDEA
jgi:predicted RNA binding protein YcfA (HicA-like mRNA interferase family)